MTIVDTAAGFEVRDGGRVVFGPASEVEVERWVLDAVWSVHRAHRG